mgnify:CR=1 FL=1
MQTENTFINCSTRIVIFRIERVMASNVAPRHRVSVPRRLAAMAANKHRCAEIGGTDWPASDGRRCGRTWFRTYAP